jgi:predicted Co/Zn/Cd cation transporter (cation efflux family)
MIRAAKLDASLYEEVEHDRTATGQAIVVVVIYSLAPAIGGMLHGGALALAFTTIAALIGWVAWAALTYLIGTRLLPEPQTEADLGEMLRSTAFATAPGAIGVLGLIPIPGIRELSLLAALIWTLIAMVIAVRQALDYKSTGRALGVCLIALSVVLILAWHPFVGTAH